MFLLRQRTAASLSGTFCRAGDARTVSSHSQVRRCCAARREAEDKNQKQGSLIQGDDTPGSIANVMLKLARAKINVSAVDAVTAGAGRFGAILRVRQRDVNRAARALGA
jgi:hypothetical protein